MRSTVPPTVTIPDDTKHYDEITTHPAYGQISASRVNGTSVLYGSDFIHNGYVTIRIHRSEWNRGLSNDWHHEREEIAEVALSEAQWATFVSTLNMGSGTPCTITSIAGRMVPGIPDPPDRHKQFKKEADARIANGLAHLDQLKAQIMELKISEKIRQSLLSELFTSRQELTANIGFVADQFTEHMETVTNHAKIEVAAYLTNAVQRAGLTKLQEAPRLELGAKREDPDDGQ